MESLEQEIMIMLRRLPIPVTITWRSGLYHWQCIQKSGSSHRLIGAVEEALAYILSTSAIPASKKSQEE